MKILITCSLPIEFNEARNQLGLKEITTKSDLPRIAEGKHVKLIYTGIGKVNTAVNLIHTFKGFKPDLVIDSGTCGSLVKEILPMDIITSTESIEFFSYDLIGHNISGDKSEIKCLLQEVEISNHIVASIEDSVDNNNSREKLLKNGASIVTWETSTIFSICQKNNIPFLSIRGVTDNCNDDTHVDFKKNRIETCKKLYNSIKMLCIGI